MGSVGAEMTSLGRYGDEPEKAMDYAVDYSIVRQVRM